MNATLLCVALLLPGYGEKDILKGIRDAGGGYGGIRCVSLPRTVTDADLGDLCELRRLDRLYLRGKQVTDEGLWTVSNLRGLTSLSLSGTDITDKGLHYLESLSNLKRLVLTECPNITDDGVARLQKALPNCTIER
jgi:hypothetical protein